MSDIEPTHPEITEDGADDTEGNAFLPPVEDGDGPGKLAAISDDPMT